MEKFGDQREEQLETALEVVAAMAAAASGDASKLLGMMARIDGLCDRLQAVRMRLRVRRTSCVGRV